MKVVLPLSISIPSDLNNVRFVERRNSKAFLNGLQIRFNYFCNFVSFSVVVAGRLTASYPPHHNTEKYRLGSSKCGDYRAVV